MNKRLIALMASIVLLAGMSPAANAATAVGPFNVKVTLNSTCTAVAPPGPDLDFGTYTAITGGATTPAPTALIVFTCTRGLTGISAAFDTFSAGTATAPTSNGVIAGLFYTLSAALGGAGTAAGTAPTGGAAPVAGTPATVVWTVTGGMAANQAGTCATASCGANQARTLTYTF